MFQKAFDVSFPANCEHALSMHIHSNCRNVYSSWVQKTHIPFMQIREITAVFDRLS
jgi:hypothetical protein